MSKRKHGPTIVPALSAKVDNKEKRFIQVGNSLLLSKQFHALSTGSRFLYFCMAMESGGRKNFILPQRTQKAHGVNPRSRLIRFSKNSSFHYFTVDEMGLRLMKLALDEMALYRFPAVLAAKRHLQSIYAPAVSVQSGAAFGGVCLEKGGSKCGQSWIEAHCFRARQML